MRDYLGWITTITHSDCFDGWSSPCHIPSCIGVRIYFLIMGAYNSRWLMLGYITRTKDRFSSLNSAGGYKSTYFPASSIARLPFRRLYLLYSNKHVILAAMITFKAGSALCGDAAQYIEFNQVRAFAGPRSLLFLPSVISSLWDRPDIAILILPGTLTLFA